MPVGIGQLAPPPMSWVVWWEDLFWIDLLSILAVRRHRHWDRLDITWFLLRMACRPVQATSVLVLGGSVTGGGGVGNRPDLAWHAALGNVRPTVHYKHAVDPSYFLHCTARFVDHSYDAVLLDLSANMFGTAASSNLAALISRTRCLTNASSVAVVHWPGVIKTNASRVATLRTGATLLEVPHGPELYAVDKVHPNARGHALIAARVRAHLDKLSVDEHPVADCARPKAETCYANAMEMPVVRDVVGEPYGWRTVDDSPTPDRLHKYGWASGTAGSNLTLVVPQGDVCGSVVTLAYLASAITGAFRLTCAPGCACTPIRTYHQKTIHPFPVVSGREDCDLARGDCNVLKITRDTTFSLLREQAQPCRVTVTALTSRGVRLDGLYVEQPSKEVANFARTSPPSSPAQRRFGERALKPDCVVSGNTSTTRPF